MPASIPSTNSARQTAACKLLAFGCIFYGDKTAVVYDFIHAVGFKTPALEMVLDRLALVCCRPIGCHPDGGCHARGRHASRLAAVIRDPAVFLAPLGPGHPDGDVSCPQIPRGTPPPIVQLAGSFGGGGRYQFSLCRLASSDGSSVESVGQSQR